MQKAEADKYNQALVSVKREQVPVPTSVEDSDWGSGAFLTPGSGMGEKSGPGIKIIDTVISERS
jgi:hypothetical protein